MVAWMVALSEYETAEKMGIELAWKRAAKKETAWAGRTADKKVCCLAASSDRKSAVWTVSWMVARKVVKSETRKALL